MVRDTLTETQADGPPPDQWRSGMVEMRRALFEDRVVEHILSAAQRSSVPALPSRPSLVAGDHCLMTFENFHSAVPEFPIRFAVPSYEAVIDCKLRLISASWKKNPIYREYASHAEGQAAMRGKPGYFALVYTASQTGLFVMHNDFPRDRSGEVETVVRTWFRRRAFCIEPFPFFLRGALDAWADSHGGDS